MKLADIKLREMDGIGRRLEPVCFGVPLAVGVCQSVDQLRLVGESGELPCDCRATQYWPDGSIRWCLFDVALPVAAAMATSLQLNLGGAALPESGIRVTDDAAAGMCQVDTGSARFSVQMTEIGARLADKGIALNHPVLRLRDSQASFRVERAQWSAMTARVKLTLKQQGVYVGEDGRVLCRFESELDFFANSSRVHWQFTLHNPRAAQHHGGLWDLGDPASLLFKGLAASVTVPGEGGVRLQLEAASEWLADVRQAHLFQASSGGEHWNSRTHVDRTGQVQLEFSGYRLQLADQDRTGKRASPLLFQAQGLGIFIDRFWQNFPKAIDCVPGQLSLKLFPDCCSFEHELQPGERKTHRVRFDFAADEESCQALRSPLLCQLQPDYIAETAAIPHFANRAEPIDALIQAGLDQGSGFLAKRELIDEYGWRNFGDIFADHESLYLPDGKLYISHYNNQYDPLYGFLRQYLMSGDPVWMAMADELAWHVGDIDIYSTEEDRAEYNGGLFWHTDHYVCAFTASHRTYSRHQKPNGRDVTQGGGPGAEHCYTQGLMLHHCLTGCERSRQAVLQLTNWITHFYEGTGTLLEQLLDVKSRVLPQVRRATRPGGILDHRYPFNRGVGNYLNGLMDCLALTGERDYLQRAERVICRTFSPDDNIADRNLADVETTWFYTIFLQAVARFLEVKKQYGEQNMAGFAYICSAFMHYARWMAEHDQPYLSRPEILEFPNDTWVAQDLRKAAILYYAGSYAVDDDAGAKLRNREEFFYQYVCETLASSNTRHYSRILAILMQNHGVQGYFQDRPDLAWEPEHPAGMSMASPYRSRIQILLAATREVFRALFRLSLRNELGWLRHRHRGCSRLYDRLYGTVEQQAVR